MSHTHQNWLFVLADRGWLTPAEVMRILNCSR